VANGKSDEASRAPRGGAAASALAALVAAASGLGVGALAYAALGTAKVMLSPGLEVSGLRGWLVGALGVFEEGLLWGLLGGAAIILPPALVCFVVLARRSRAGRGAPASLAAQALVTFVLFTPLFLSGLRGRAVEGALVALAIGLGVRHGLRELARRIVAE